MKWTDEHKEALVNDYIQAYNRMDTTALVATLHPEVRFEHVVDAEVVLQLEGRAAFQQQFETTNSLFTVHIQQLNVRQIMPNSLTATVHFYGKLKPTPETTIPQELRLDGEAYYEFKDQKIIYIQDRQ